MQCNLTKIAGDNAIIQPSLANGNESYINIAEKLEKLIYTFSTPIRFTD